jgi:hypothetical protein
LLHFAGVAVAQDIDAHTCCSSVAVVAGLFGVTFHGQAGTLHFSGCGAEFLLQQSFQDRFAFDIIFVVGWSILAACSIVRHNWGAGVSSGVLTSSSRPGPAADQGQSCWWLY